MCRIVGWFGCMASAARRNWWSLARFVVVVVNAVIVVEQDWAARIGYRRSNGDGLLCDRKSNNRIMLCLRTFRKWRSMKYTLDSPMTVFVKDFSRSNARPIIFSWSCEPPKFSIVSCESSLIELRRDRRPGNERQKRNVWKPVCASAVNGLNVFVCVFICAVCFWEI